MQVFVMYIGEAICLIIYVVHSKMNPEQMEIEKEKAIAKG